MSVNVATAQAAELFGDFEKVYELLKNENKSRPKVLSMLGASCFLTGRFEEAKVLYDRFFVCQDINHYELGGLDVSNYDPQGFKFHKILEFIDTELFTFPSNLNYNYPQSIEGSDEVYPDSKQVNYVLSNRSNFNGDIILRDFIEKTINELNSSDKNIRSQACFNLAEIFLAQGKYIDALTCYKDAIKVEPSKALYYGYAAQLFPRLAFADREKYVEMYLSMCIFTRRAVDLDYENAKWHHLHAIACFNLSKVIDRRFLITCKLELKKALDCCRPDQKTLKNSIKELCKIYKLDIEA